MATDYFHNYQAFTAADMTPPSPIGAFTRKKTSREASLSVEPQHESHDLSPVSPLSPVDTRRMTPTLHAALVSEILGLRRELEAKDGYIDNLEADLQATKYENDLLTNRLVASARNTRSIEREIEQAQKHLHDVTSELSEERDQAIAAGRDTRDKLDTLTRKNRRQEEDFASWQKSWDDERQKWDNERRQLETRVHVTENRLRIVVEEFNAQQVALTNLSQASPQLMTGEEAVDDAFKDSGFGNDSEVASVRSATMYDHHRTKSGASLISNPRSLSSPSKVSQARGRNFSLADELDFEEEDDYGLDEFEHHDSDVMLEGRRSPALEVDAKAKKVLGLNVSSGNTSAAHSQDVDLAMHHLERRTGTRNTDQRRPSSSSVTSIAAAPLDRRDSKTQVKYIHTGVQPSAHLWEDLRQAIFAEALQQRKNSAASAVTHTSPVKQQPEKVYQCLGTQTTPMDSKQPLSHPILQIPSIAIHPPTSRPSSARFAVLPPGTRNAACQTDSGPVINSNNASVQTEEIRPDSRAFKTLTRAPSDQDGERTGIELPRNLSIRDLVAARVQSPPDAPHHEKPTSSETTRQTAKVRPSQLKAINLPSPVLLSSPQRFQNFHSAQEDQPSSSAQQYGERQPQSNGISSAMQKFLDLDSDISDHEANIASAEDVFGSTPALHRYNSPEQHPRLPRTVPEDSELSPPRDRQANTSYRKDERLVNSSSGNIGYGRPRKSSTSRDWLTRNAPNQFGSIPQRQHSRSASGETNASSMFSVHSQPPPLPIPRRSSSRMYADAMSDGNNVLLHDGGSPATTIQRYRSIPKGSTGLRKVQSANTMRTPSQASSSKKRRRTPPLTPIRSSVIESPTTAAQTPVADYLKEPQMVTTPVSDFDDITSAVKQRIDEPVDDTCLVDAVASVMVGGWMWKYVQKRKSFGIGDPSNTFKEDGMAKHNSTRHKRWVWLSPYERTIMWSSKQPTTGAALMGKNGRKLQIKTILDVKDNNPLPKGESYSTVFDRSIIVLTPSRALKLTAPSKDRHYLWLMALSFLANPSELPPQVPRVPEAKPEQATDHNLPASKNHVIEKSIDRANVRNFSEPIKSSTKAITFDAETLRSASHSVLEPPALMRPLESYARHTRKRSSTGPSRIMSSASSLRSKTSFATPTSPSFPIIPFQRSRAGSVAPPSSQRRSARASTMASHNHSNRSVPKFGEIEADGPGEGEGDQGMVRMEAFVNTSYKDGVLYVPALPPTRPSMRLRGSSQRSCDTVGSRKRNGYVMDGGRDPFTGF